ncbi:hypothetical protein FACS1894199_04990 [Bacteroidia bacterium]|nr:hypothetical protein FACS1894199_04990 [Bacteroidia bacterium]
MEENKLHEEAPTSLSAQSDNSDNTEKTLVGDEQTFKQEENATQTDERAENKSDREQDIPYLDVKHNLDEKIALCNEAKGTNNAFFESLQKEQENNLLVKEELCAKVEQLARAEYHNINEWNKAAQTLMDSQDEWQHIGTVLLKERNKIYRRFKTACDEFFDKKRVFFKDVLQDQDKNLALKTELCERVEALKDSEDWKMATDKIIACQREWRKIGPAPQKHSNKVWNRFHAACDEFFAHKKLHFNSIDSEQEKNLELKKGLLEEVKQYVPSESNDDNLLKLKEFQKRWAGIGFVPLKDKEALHNEFRQAINTHFDKLNLGEFDKKMEKFKVKLQNFDNGEHKESKIINERDKLISKIRQSEAEINTWENNIGFFSKSKKSEGVVLEMNVKIGQAKERLSLLQEKLKALDSII